MRKLVFLLFASLLVLSCQQKREEGFVINGTLKEMPKADV